MPRQFQPEFRQRAVRMLEEALQDHETEYAAVRHVADKLGVAAETLRKWRRAAQVDSGQREGVTTVKAEEVKALRREVRELCEANAMADSTGGRNEFGELLRWCQIAEGFAGSGVERVLDRDQFGTTDEAQIGALRQVLA